MTTYLAQANTGADALASVRTVTKPAPVGAGAVGVFWLVRWHESGSFPAVTPPAGAILRGTITTASMQTQCYLHRVNAETSFAYSWTSGRWSTLAAVWFSGVDPAADLATVPFQSATGSGTAIGTLTVTSNVDSALAWHVNTIDTSGVTHTPPTGFTEVADVSPAASAYRITVTSGSQDASGATASPTTAWAAGLVALPPASTGGVTGDATLTGTAGLSAAGTGSRSGGAALAGAAGLAAGGVRRTSSTAALAATAALTATGVRSGSRTADLDAAAGLDAAGQITIPGDASLEAAAELTSTGHRTTAADAGVTAGADLTSSGLIDHPGQGQLTATAHIEAAGLRATTTAAGIAGTATLTADGVVGSPPITGAAALAVAVGLAASARRTTSDVAVLHATATLAASGAAAGDRSAGLAATAVLSAAGTTSASGDDIEATVGAPYSSWTAGPPQPSAWAAGVPQPSSWEVGVPW
ncbi:hypothetical protein ACIRP5_11230 [Streptomyces sp. NPDC101221]|uniref:hypothetical protein n=1 Tax=Streptomyces sp. NPDC101221 TaxID=3366132 RepID=UPI00381DCD7B